VPNDFDHDSIRIFECQGVVLSPVSDFALAAAEERHADGRQVLLHPIYEVSGFSRQCEVCEAHARPVIRCSPFQVPAFRLG
jgi:hypothetical protein